MRRAPARRARRASRSCRRRRARRTGRGGRVVRVVGHGGIMPHPLPFHRMRFVITGAAGMLGQDLVAAAGARRSRGGGVLARRARHHRSPQSVRRALTRRGRTWWSTARRGRTSTGPRAAGAGALAVNGAGAGNVARAAAARRRVDDPRLERLRVRRRQALAIRGIGRGRAGVVVRPLEAGRGARGGATRRPSATRSCARHGCSAPAVRAFRRRSCGSRASAMS